MNSGLQVAQRQQRLENQLWGVSRCPYCAIASPQLLLMWRSSLLSGSDPSQTGRLWATYTCTACGSVLLAKGKLGDGNQNALVDSVLPTPRAAHDDLPPIARRYLDQAYQTLAAPDAATVMAGSAVDAMLKALGLNEGSVYVRINQARDNGKLTAEMAEWAHSVRLEANRPRHVDDADPHVTEKDALRSVEFAEALGNFLFVLSARIKRGIDAAKA